MNLSVARCYRFTGTHSIPTLPLPWSAVHRHGYTVEVVAEGELREGIVVDTDLLDAAWREEGLNEPYERERLGHDLNKRYGGENTTVELLAVRFLDLFVDVPEVVSVTVWEDDTRWGRATR